MVHDSSRITSRTGIRVSEYPTAARTVVLLDACILPGGKGVGEGCTNEAVLLPMCGGITVAPTLFDARHSVALKVRRVWLLSWLTSSERAATQPQIACAALRPQEQQLGSAPT